MKKMSLQLREVEEKDLMLLYQWANDPQVRENAFHTEQIPLADHKRWFHRMLQDETVKSYILCQQQMPLGQIRLNIENQTALIDYSIDAAQRGKGLGSQLLLLAEEKLRQTSFQGELVGQVKHTNIGSAKAFRKCGFSQASLPDYIEFRKQI